MDYETLRAVGGTVGLIIFVLVFAGVLAYALWPRNKKKFEHAAHIPLQNNVPEDEAQKKEQADQDDVAERKSKNGDRGG